MEIGLIVAAVVYYLLPALVLFISSFLYKIYGTRTLKIISMLLLIFALLYYCLIAFKYADLFDPGLVSAILMIFQVFTFTTVFICALIIFLKK